MSNIFDEDSDSEVGIKTNNEYAKNYDTWRKKEELNRLKTKYGEELLEEESSSSSDDDEEGVELTEEVEKQFFKTLSCLKNKDPRIYDESVKFFDDRDKDEQKSKKKSKKEKPMYINDYERELILKKNGELSDSDEAEDDPRSNSPTYVEEQKKIKENLKKALSKVTEDHDDEWGGMLKVRPKTEEEKMKEEADYKEWLAGQKDEIDDKEVESELKPLKDYWNNPDLDEGEKFLRDYILHKRFLSNEEEDYYPTYEEVIHDSDKDLSEDENAIEKQEEFEQKYNFRFEEPDQEFIKRYPRTMEQSLRKTDDRRKIKRAETKERKQKEKEQKMQEMKKLQELKRKEIEEKIQKLKEITGNDDIEFKDEDLEGDFDPEAHDKKMQSLFNDEFYEGPEGEQKPECPELDELLEIENWEKWNGEDEPEDSEQKEDSAPHCEDEDFNMDCDYDPTADVKKELIENSKGKKKRKRKSLFAQAVSQPKPVFDPNNKTYEEYLDEYYKFDCEDIIGDIPCRFKYRKVIPNSFGLTIEEILSANDRELNKWCSLKKAVQHRADEIEKYEQIAYERKAKNIDLKRKILPSLFVSEKTDEEKDQQVEEAATKKKKKMKKVRCKKGVKIDQQKGISEERIKVHPQQARNTEETKAVVNIKKERKGVEAGGITKETKTQVVIKKERMKDEVAENTEKIKTQAKIKKEKKDGAAEILEETNSATVNTKPKKNKKKKKKVQNNNSSVSENSKSAKKRKISVSSNTDVPKKKAKIASKDKKRNIGISDARLTAYGINPKKFKNKLKYKKS